MNENSHNNTDILNTRARVMVTCALSLSIALTGCGKSATEIEAERIKAQMIRETKQMEDSKKNSFMDKGLPPLEFVRNPDGSVGVAGEQKTPPGSAALGKPSSTPATPAAKPPVAAAPK